MKNKKLPKFYTLQQEARFWETHNITDYWDDMEPVKLEFIPLKKKEETITIRLEPELKKRIEQIANQNRLTLSTIVRLWLIDKLKKEVI